MVAPVVVLGWVALGVAAVPLGLMVQQRESEQALRTLGAALIDDGHGGLYVAFTNLPSEQALLDASPHLKRTRPSALSISGASITSLEPIKDLTSLTFLAIYNASGITSLEPIKDLPNLTSIELLGNTGITSLAPLKGKHINIAGASDELLATMK